MAYKVIFHVIFRLILDTVILNSERFIMNYENKKIDLICQHCSDGTIIPIRLRFPDEDGVLQEYTVKGYKDTSECGLIKFDCNIVANNTVKKVTIFTSQTSYDGIWKLSVRN